VIKRIAVSKSTDIVVGLDGYDDAAVTRGPADGMDLVHTIDFFPPMVDSPTDFGAIAAANAISDVYAMGGEPRFATSVLCWPVTSVPEEAIEAMLEAAVEKLHEAGAALLGGHSIKSSELNFGLSVTGEVRKNRHWTVGGAKPGDLLVLTKAIGTGIIMTAANSQLCDAEAFEAAVASMQQLNKHARDIAAELDVHACTDITGSGVLGHALEMSRNSETSLRIFAEAVPTLPGAAEAAAQGIKCGAHEANYNFVRESLVLEGEVSEATILLLNDPQTSGGLLFSMTPADAHLLTKETEAIVIGEVVDGSPALILSEKK
jgi:selenide, water dikinase